jgi:alpha-glucosidase
LPVATAFPVINVAVQRDDPASMLTLYRRLIALRRATPALAVGSYTPVEAHGDVFAYIRTHDKQRCLVVLNLRSQPQQIRLRHAEVQGHIVLSTHLDHTGEAGRDVIELRGDEGLIIALG